jgi:hypothetical protein
VLSDKAAKGFEYYRTGQNKTMNEFIGKSFKGTEHTQQLVKLLNDSYDVVLRKQFFHQHGQNKKQ